MRSKEEIQKRIDGLKHEIDSELDNPAEDMMKQYLNLKAFHAMRVALEWALEEGGA